MTQQPDPTAKTIMTTDPATGVDLAWEQRRRDVEVEYGQFTAVQDIHVGNALAFTAGSPVPASTVHAHQYDALGLVTRNDDADVDEGDTLDAGWTGR